MSLHCPKATDRRYGRHRLCAHERPILPTSLWSGLSYGTGVILGRAENVAPGAIVETDGRGALGASDGVGFGVTAKDGDGFGVTAKDGVGDGVVAGRTEGVAAGVPEGDTDGSTVGVAPVP
jgi:hypothetical protein